MKATIATDLAQLPKARIIQIIDAVRPTGIEDGISITVFKGREHRARYGQEQRHIGVELNESAPFPCVAMVEGERFEIRSLEECALVLLACSLIRARNAQEAERMGTAQNPAEWARDKLEAYRRGDLKFAEVVDRRPKH